MYIPQVYHIESGIGLYDGRGPGGFIVNYVRPGDHCIDAANPDIGGIGTVLSAVVQSLLTTSALLVITLLDDTISERWSHALLSFIRASGDTAAFVGFCLLISGYVNLPLTSDRNAKLLHFQDAYFSLCVYICAAFSSIHIASLLTLRQRYGKHPTTTALRLTLLVCFSSLLTATVVLSRYAYEPCFILMEIILVERMHMPVNMETALEYVLPAAVLLYIFWVSAWQYICPDEKRDNPPLNLWRRVLRFILFSNRKTVIGFQIFSAIGSVIFIMLQRFILAPKPTAQDRAEGVGEWCSLNNSRNNEWAFGQACAMLLLLIPFYAAAEGFWNPEADETPGEKVDLEGRRNSDIPLLRQGFNSLDSQTDMEMFHLQWRRSSVT